ncbi:MAG: DUF1571 domain-containing protein [Fimbriiglobus sp.]|nr:DUF1571 domain-containing protein [Fimbriiglobus sp.]
MDTRLLVALLAAAVTVVPSACLRTKKESSLLAELQKPKVPAPQPPLPTAGGDIPPPSVGVQPPKFDTKTSPAPALPGMPGTASQPFPPATVPDSPGGRAEPDRDTLLASATPDERQLLLAAATDEPTRKGILQRIRDRFQQRQKEKEKELPPATEPRKDEPKPPALPPSSPAVPPEPTVKPKIELKTEPEPKSAVNPPARPEGKPAVAANADLKTVRELLEVARKKNEATPSFEAHLTKREVVKGKEMPTEEAVYRFRREPLSVHIRVVGDAGTGREVMWVKGQNDNKLTVVTGKGDTILGGGIKTTVDPDDPRATARSRYKIYEAGMQRPIGALTKFVEQAETGQRPADTVRALGPVERKEYKAKLNVVEVTLTADDDKFLPKGGKRVYHFDADPKSSSYGLPVLVISLDHDGKEVEYYCFTDFKLVGELTDADFDHTKVGKKK